MPNPFQVSIIISCFNEEKSVEQCVRTVHDAMPDAEIVVVHGGNDRTLEIARSLKAEIPNINPVRNENDRGKGHGIKTGVENAQGSVMAQFDADLQFKATDLPILLAPILTDQADVSLGSRFLPASDRAAYKPSLFRDLGNRILAAYVSVLTGKKVTDVTGGMKAWTRSAIEKIAFRDDKYSYEAEIVVRAGLLGMRIVEVPVNYASRCEGGSMHANNLAVIRAGFIIIVKCFACWIRTLFTRKK
jgi:glycosyltransferase involved in cell wall biosynthesis